MNRCSLDKMQLVHPPSHQCCIKNKKKEIKKKKRKTKSAKPQALGHCCHFTVHHCLSPVYILLTVLQTAPLQTQCFTWNSLHMEFSAVLVQVLVNPREEVFKITPSQAACQFSDDELRRTVHSWIDHCLRPRQRRCESSVVVCLWVFCGKDERLYDSAQLSMS